MITAAGGTPVRVRINLHTMDLDLEAIRKAITPKTRAIIINSPNNPTGKVYPPRTLERLSSLLTRESQRYRRTIFLISDESYSHVVFDDLECPSPAQYYPHTLLIYTYGKTLLAPGQRIGYIALPEKMPERSELREAIFTTQIITAYAFPNALLQHALADLDQLSIDIPHLQSKRDRIVDGLREIGYRVHKPEGTFYALPVSPIEDDAAFVNELSKQKIYCLPGNVLEMPGYFRISFTANMDMIERSLPGFEAAYHAVKRIRRAAPRFKVAHPETEKA
jgi:aspartate aminotransferase